MIKDDRLEVAKDMDIGVFAKNGCYASYKYIQPMITEITLMGGRDDIYFVGHIHQFEKAEGVCLYFVETDDIPLSVHGVAPWGDCRCPLCREVREKWEAPGIH